MLSYFFKYIYNYKNSSWYTMLCLRIYILLRTSSFKMAYYLGRQEYEVLELEDFLSNEECNQLILLAKQKAFIQSTISNDKGERIVDIAIRKSIQCWLSNEENKCVETISKRIQEYIPLPLENQEDLQIVKYDKNDFYKKHYDTPYHDFAISKFNKFCGPRVATFLIYLNDDYTGGETEFIMINKKVKPKKGKAILFYNIDVNLNLIPESIHLGNKIIDGEKWIANKWIRVWPFKINNTFHITQNTWMMNIKKCNIL